MISYSTQYIDDDDIKNVSEALKNPLVSCGPLLEEFESKIANYIGVKYAVAVSSGTAALHTACYIAGVKKGDEVITSPITWVSSANAAFYCGAKTQFADIDKKTYNITVENIKEKINNNTKVLLPVDYAGCPCDMDEINKLANENGLIVIEDAAEALGAKYKGRNVGTLSDITIFSFHAIKPLTTCEGGLVVTNNQQYYEAAKAFRAYGISKSEKEMLAEEPWAFDQVGIGLNYRLTEIQCALGLSQLKKIDFMLNKRKRVTDIYNEKLKGLPSVILPEEISGYEGNKYMYPILVNEKKRREYYLKFRKAGIGVGVCFRPVYKNTYYLRNGYNSKECENAEWFYNRVLNLPVHARLSDDEINYIIRKAREIIVE